MKLFKQLRTKTLINLSFNNTSRKIFHSEVLYSKKFFSNKCKSEQNEINIKKENLKKRIGDMSFFVTQEKGTEMPFSGEYLSNKEEGVYRCIVCDSDLFSSDHKYDSKSGWPSFYDSNHQKNLKINVDNSHGMIREEVRCSNCAAHLGHLFNDGPSPTQKRYCINSSSLNFVYKEDN